MLTVDFTLIGSAYLGLNIGGSDPRFAFNDAVSFQIHCRDQPEVDRLWSALSKDGRELGCGWLKDRWGLAWQIVPTRLQELLDDPDPARARRAMEAMGEMIKIDIAALERAAAG